ncbi:AadA family aminoglycoside 3''-O-nucleotidyltransferase [Noviherbaspirillum sp. CPCC 100848]|uniref:Aminoglycoside (3'') (9) adenylyltransferase n=1 Tax=Noviherbaspirillum album TaxID=3080276 RepID=A0ABU6JHL3_9BURK|nr:AadA family aminoglycoside 3''-O-nucleotidyltransferase [Noviherbaspirillum sp. CPCC 100848]MEC4723155.1 AadA family aminoglycoside 3''-O-nucleotidyltransferase [Noviherbaspirillum sp. CPCC 100848]
MTIGLPEAITKQVFDTLSVLKHHLGEAIQAIYLFGSAIHGGLKPFSDIDLLVTINAPLDDTTRAALMSELLSVSAPPGTDLIRRALEVTVLAQEDVLPWRYPAKRQMQFGEWLRDDINLGIYEPAMTDHDLAILLTKVRRHSLALYGPAAQEYFNEIPAIDIQRSLLDTLALWNTESDWEGDERNIILALVRIWYTATTEDIASKDDAANWALGRLPVECQQIVAAARDGYLGLEVPDLVGFPKEREMLLNHIRSNVIAILRQKI